MAGAPPPFTDPFPDEEEDDDVFAPTLPSTSTASSASGETQEDTPYRSLAERYGLPTMSQLENYDLEVDSLEAQLIQAGVNVEDPAIQILLAEPAFQEILTGDPDIASGLISFLVQEYPDVPTQQYDQALIESGFGDTAFMGPTIEPGGMAALTSGTDEQIAKFRKETPNYEENPDTGWLRYKNGVLVSPDGQVAFDPTSAAPGSLKWQREVVSGWSAEKVEQWADRLVEYGYLPKEAAKKATKTDPAFLNALSSYHMGRYVYGKPVNGEFTGVGATSDQPPLVDFEEMKAQTRNFVREEYRRVYGQEPSDGEVLSMADAIIKQAMNLQRRYRRRDNGLGAGDAATEAEERFIERLEGSPEAEFLREREEENTALRDALSQAAVVTNSLAS